jgi:DNA-binding NarL/FixJ family response regulator
VFETNSEAISELSQMKILTEDDWRKFKKLFSEVYPEFLSNATLRSFSLSTAELRLLMLLKINLTTKEIASSLGVSDGAIRTTKYRILKKTKEAGIDDIQTLLDET